jgi:hypothetical protein
MHFNRVSKLFENFWLNFMDMFIWNKISHNYLLSNNFFTAEKEGRVVKVNMEQAIEDLYHLKSGWSDHVNCVSPANTLWKMKNKKVAFYFRGSVILHTSEQSRTKQIKCIVNQLVLHAVSHLLEVYSRGDSLANCVVCD